MTSSPNQPEPQRDPVPQSDPGLPGEPLIPGAVPTQQEEHDQRYVSQRRQPAAGIGCAVLFVVILVIWYVITQSGLFG